MKQIFTLITILLCTNLYGQNLVKIKNGSFELDEAGFNQEPSHWLNCGFEGQELPEIHSSDSYVRLVDEQAKDGYQFLGLIAREDGTFNGLCQELDIPLVGGNLYTLDLALKTAARYGVKRRKPFLYATQPIVLNIWACTSGCAESELLVQSELIENTDWKVFNYILRPSKNYTVIRIEAAHSTTFPEPYGGNLLVDDISDIKIVDTIKRMPITIDDALIDFVDLKNKEEKKLEQLIYDVMQASIENNTQIAVLGASGLKAVYLSKKLEEELENQDFRFYLMNLNEPRLREILRSLDQLEYKELSELFRKGYSLFLKNKAGEITKEELEEFNNLHEVFLEIGTDKQLRLSYIKNNFDQLVKELRYSR